jgi:hypothetical protein
MIGIDNLFESQKTKGRVSNYLAQAFDWEAEKLLLDYGFLPIMINREKASFHGFKLGLNKKVQTYKVFKSDKKTYLDFFNKYFDQGAGIRFSFTTPIVMIKSKAWLELIESIKQ